MKSLKLSLFISVLWLASFAQAKELACFTENDALEHVKAKNPSIDFTRNGIDDLYIVNSYYGDAFNIFYFCENESYARYEGNCWGYHKYYFQVRKSDCEIDPPREKNRRDLRAHGTR